LEDIFVANFEGA